MTDDLLALLKRVERVMREHNEDRAERKEDERCEWDFGELHGGTLDAVRAAIAKAEGRQTQSG